MTFKVGDWVRFYRNGALVLTEVRYLQKSDPWDSSHWTLQTDQGEVGDDAILEVRSAPAKFTSEEICQACGGPNVVWFAPNDIYNRAGASGILCPTCFIQLAESKGIKPTGWRLEPEESRAAKVSMTYGELPKSLSDLIEPHEWDNKNISEQRDWAVQQLAEATERAEKAEAERQRLEQKISNQRHEIKNRLIEISSLHRERVWIGARVRRMCSKTYAAGSIAGPLDEIHETLSELKRLQLELDAARKDTERPA